MLANIAIGHRLVFGYPALWTIPLLLTISQHRITNVLRVSFISGQKEAD